MSLLKIPLFDQLKDCERVLLAGCGGGYDMFSGIPLYFALKSQGKEVFLSNLTFTRDLDCVSGEWVGPCCLEVRPDAQRWNAPEPNVKFAPDRDGYFPEYHLSKWFQEEEKLDVPVYTFKRVGARPMRKSYKALATKLKLDAIVLVDGGTDSLMRGDEDGLGTPVEDMSSIVAVSRLKTKTPMKKLLSCLGFGVDSFHHVYHNLFLENTASLIQKGAFFGVLQLLPTMVEAQKFKESYLACRPENSIVCSSVLSAIEGNYGNYHSPHTQGRTEGSTLYISPMMSQFWFFDLEAVEACLLYGDLLVNTKTCDDIRAAIGKFRSGTYQDVVTGRYVGKRKGSPIPY